MSAGDGQTEAKDVFIPNTADELTAAWVVTPSAARAWIVQSMTSPSSRSAEGSA